MDLINNVTVRLARLSPDDKAYQEGFTMSYACGGGPDSKPCRNTPGLLMTSNAMQTAACKRHIVAILNKVIDAVLRDANGEARPGFLRRPKAWRSSQRHEPAVEATGDIVWSSKLDHRYDVTVYRATIPYGGVLVVKDGASQLARSTVRLSYDAKFGPDVADVEAWANAAMAIVDETKPPGARLNDAVDEVERDRSARLARLRTRPLGGEAYSSALEVFRAPEPTLRWLISPNVALNGQAPDDILVDEKGLERLRDILENIVKTRYPLGAA